MKTIVTKASQLLILALATSFASAETWIVDNDESHPADFRSAQEAHDAASAGDTLLIVGSTQSYGPIDMFKKLKLIGPGYWHNDNQIKTPTPLSANIDYVQIEEGGDSDGASFCGLEIGSVHFENASNIHIDQCRIDGTMNFIAGNSNRITRSFLYGIDLYPGNLGTTGGTVVVSNSYARGLTVQVGFASAIVVSYSVVDVNLGTLWAAPGSRIDMSNCIIMGTLTEDPETNHGRHVSYSAIQEDSSWISSDPTNHSFRSFRDVFRGNARPPFSEERGYHFAPNDNQDNVALTSSSEGSEVGMFGGEMPYILSGIPAIPRVNHFTTTGIATETSGIRVRVGGETHSEE